MQSQPSRSTSTIAGIRMSQACPAKKGSTDRLASQGLSSTHCQSSQHKNDYPMSTSGRVEHSDQASPALAVSDSAISVIMQAVGGHSPPGSPNTSNVAVHGSVSSHVPLHQNGRPGGPGRPGRPGFKGIDEALVAVATPASPISDDASKARTGSSDHIGTA
ncbi:hypothetical protein IAU60_004066 [Kwoniella sp. DSM 27419]